MAAPFFCGAENMQRRFGNNVEAKDQIVHKLRHASRAQLTISNAPWIKVDANHHRPFIKVGGKYGRYSNDHHGAAVSLGNFEH